MAVSVGAALTDRGLTLPPPVQLPPDVEIPFGWSRLHGHRMIISGHGALSSEGTPAGPFGRVPTQVSIEDAQQSAVNALLSILGTVQRAITDLDRIEAWLSVTCYVNAEPGFEMLTLIANPMSELLLEIFGPERGAHTRTTPGVAALPFDLPIILAAELAVVA